MRAEFLDQEGAEGGVFSFAEEFPYVGVSEGCEGGDFELQEVVLRRVQVDGVDAAWVL